jgi:haloacetate dehalogenase
MARRLIWPPGAHGPSIIAYEPLELWREWADEVHGSPIASGHFLPEEAPDEITKRLLAFLRS